MLPVYIFFNSRYNAKKLVESGISIKSPRVRNRFQLMISPTFFSFVLKYLSVHNISRPIFSLDFPLVKILLLERSFLSRLTSTKSFTKVKLSPLKFEPSFIQEKCQLIGDDRGKIIPSNPTLYHSADVISNFRSCDSILRLNTPLSFSPPVRRTIYPKSTLPESQLLLSSLDLSSAADVSSLPVSFRQYPNRLSMGIPAQSSVLTYNTVPPRILLPSLASNATTLSLQPSVNPRVLSHFIEYRQSRLLIDRPNLHHQPLRTRSITTAYESESDDFFVRGLRELTRAIAQSEISAVAATKKKWKEKRPQSIRHTRNKKAVQIINATYIACIGEQVPGGLG